MMLILFLQFCNMKALFSKWCLDLTEQKKEYFEETSLFRLDN